MFYIMTKNHNIERNNEWIEVSERIYMDWGGSKKTKNHCAHVQDYWNEMYRRADAKYHAQLMS